MTAFVPLDTIDPSRVEALLDRAFGTDRHGRTAYKVRGAAAMMSRFSFAAVEDGALIGSIQCWPIVHVGDDGVTRPLVMVGPVAVEPGRQGDGIGRALMTMALAAADTATNQLPLMLIGDPDYYGRLDLIPNHTHKI